MSFVLGVDFVCFEKCKQVLLSKGENDSMEGCAKINIRLHNYPESMIALKNLKAAYIGNYEISVIYSSR